MGHSIARRRIFHNYIYETALESADREIQAHVPQAIPQEREQLDELGFDQLWVKMVKANKPWLR
ncbi:hypothetical protein R4769_20525 [Azotobacter beijerinckii]|nr:hypothetical protein [Azotobacter beijerinckii]